MTDQFRSIRASSLPAWNDCPRREAAKLFRKDVEAAGFIIPSRRRFISASIGTGAHAGAMHAAKAKSKDIEVGLDEANDVSISAFHKEIADGVEFDKQASNVKQAEKQVRLITEKFIFDVLPNIDPLYVEEYYEITLPTEIPYKVTGHSDLIEKNGVIRDLKTGKTAWGYQAQLGAYSILQKANLDGMVAPRLVIDRINRSDFTHQEVSFNTDMCEAEAKSAIKFILAQHGKFLKHGIREIFPANPMSVLCSNRYCPAHGTSFCSYKKEDSGGEERTSDT